MSGPVSILYDRRTRKQMRSAGGTIKIDGKVFRQWKNEMDRMLLVCKSYPFCYLKSNLTFWGPKRLSKWQIVFQPRKRENP